MGHKSDRTMAAKGEAMFEEYKSEFGDLSLAISRNVYNIPNLAGGEKKALIDETSNKVAEAETLLSYMNIELQEMPKATAKKYEGQIQQCTETLRNHQKEFKACRFALPKEANAREGLLGGTDVELMERSQAQREKAQDGIQRLQSDNDKVRNMLQLANETSAIGQGALSTLDEQGNQMRRMRGNLGEAEAGILQSGKFIRAMQNRTVITKITVACIILFLVVTIIVVIWVKWFHKSSNSLQNGGVALSSPPPPPPSPPPPVAATTH
eukprot:c35019_g1_i1.p1 GENE.c35019_g1_i1~~c35019_g1_i1.p1  ORF type:complete len:267 (-),score=64.78 c35019_g1_i1:14-814(-)